LREIWISWGRERQGEGWRVVKCIGGMKMLAWLG
jgi:hypothetical protein